MRPSLSRNMTSFSPRSIMRLGAQSGDGNSVDGSAGIQYCRISSPIGVPRPTRQISSLFSLDSMRHSPGAGDCRPRNNVILFHILHREAYATSEAVGNAKFCRWSILIVTLARATLAPKDFSAGRQTVLTQRLSRNGLRYSTVALQRTESACAHARRLTSWASSHCGRACRDEQEKA